jgi:hypothetical protein
MSERLFYGEDPEPKRRKFEDFSDEEILQIVDEASVVLESDQDEDDYDRQVRETDRRIREKYHIDADTLNKMRQREFEIVAERGRKRLEEGQGTEFEKTSREMREVFRKKREDRTKQNREMFRALAEYNFDGNLTSEERLLRAIFGQQTEKKDVTPGFAGQLLGVDDIDSDDLYVEVQRQKVEFDYFLAEGPSSLKLDMGSLRRIKDNLSKCHEAVATHWGKRHLYDLTANSISNLTPNFFKDDYQEADKQFRQLEFIIKYASGETRFQAVEFALNCLRADFKNYLQTGAGPKQEFSFNADEWQSEYEETFSQVGYKLLANTIIYGDAEQSAEANKILEQRWPVQKESQSRVEFVDPPYSEFAEAIVEQRGELSGIIKGLQNVIRDSSPSPSNPEEAKRLQEKMALGRTFILKLANFAGGRMARYQFTKLAGQEIAAFVAIEKEAPGAIEKLKDNFNIEFPGRYPREVLMEMLDEHSDKKPYGVLVYLRMITIPPFIRGDLIFLVSITSLKGSAIH